MSLLENERKAEEHARTIANEAAKLTAAYPNGLAVVAVGFFAPVFAPRSPLPPTQATLHVQALIGLLCLGMSGVRHCAARSMPRGMR